MEERKRRGVRFNLVDGIVLLIVLLGAVFLGMKLLGGGESVAHSAGRIEYTVLVPGVRAEVCQHIEQLHQSAGAVQLMANGAMVDGYVTAVSSTPHVTHEANADGVVVTAQEQGEDARWDMLFTIQAAVDSAVTNKVGTQEVRVGKSHIVKTADYELEGYENTVILSRTALE